MYNATAKFPPQHKNRCYCQTKTIKHFPNCDENEDNKLTTTHKFVKSNEFNKKENNYVGGLPQKELFSSGNSPIYRKSSTTPSNDFIMKLPIQKWKDDLISLYKCSDSLEDILNVRSSYANECANLLSKQLLRTSSPSIRSSSKINQPEVINSSSLCLNCPQSYTQNNSRHLFASNVSSCSCIRSGSTPTKKITKKSSVTKSTPTNSLALNHQRRY